MRRLDIDPELVKSSPKVTDSLINCFGKWKRGNPRSQIINYLDASGLPVGRAFTACWRSMRAADVEKLPIEAICVAARVSPLEVFAAIVMGVSNLKKQESALKAVLAHPEVVDATIRAAISGPPVLVDGKPVKDKNGEYLRLDNGSHLDRKILHEAIGFLPTRKGSEVEINFFGRKADKEDDEPDNDEQAWDDAFPSISGSLEKWSEDRRNLSDRS